MLILILNHRSNGPRTILGSTPFSICHGRAAIRRCRSTVTSIKNKCVSHIAKISVQSADYFFSKNNMHCARYVRWAMLGLGFLRPCKKNYTCIVKCTSDGLQTRIVKKMHSKDYKINSTGAIVQCIL